MSERLAEIHERRAAGFLLGEDYDWLLAEVARLRACGAKVIAVSPVEWAGHIRSARVNALRDAAVFFERDMDTAWGGGKQWLTTGTKVAELVADILREQADELDSGTRCHNGHLFTPGVSTDHALGDSDPRWCNTCGEVRGER